MESGRALYLVEVGEEDAVALAGDLDRELLRKAKRGPC